MDIKSILLQLHNDLVQLDLQQPILVTWENNELVYRQYNKLFIAGYLSPLFFPIKKFRYGVLTQSATQKLLGDLVTILQDPTFSNNDLIFTPAPLGIRVYTWFKDKRLIGPQVKYELKLVSITSKFLSRLILKRYSSESRLTLKLVDQERSNKSK